MTSKSEVCERDSAYVKHCRESDKRLDKNPLTKRCRRCRVMNIKFGRNNKKIKFQRNGGRRS